MFASDLGWKPGHWPQTFSQPEHWPNTSYSGMTWKRGNAVLHHGEFAGYEYYCEHPAFPSGMGLTTAWITIYND